MKYAYFKDVWSILLLKEKKKFFFVLSLSLLLPFIELFGIGSVFAFIEIILNPSSINNSVIIGKIEGFLKIENKKTLIIVLGFLVITSLVIRNIFLAFHLWMITSFGTNTSAALSARLLISYVKYPYHFFVENNPTTLLKNITHEARNITTGFFVPLLNITSGIFVFITIFLSLLFYNFSVTILIFGVLGSLYSVVYFFSKTFFSKRGKERFELNQKSYTYTSQLINGIQEIKVLNRENYFYKKCEEIFFKNASLITKVNVLIRLPRLSMELLIFSSIILVVLYKFSYDSNSIIQSSVSLLALFGMSAYRLMPYLDGLFQAITTIHRNTIVVDEMKKHLIKPQEKKLLFNEKEITSVKNNISFKKVSFNYDLNQKYSLNKLDIEILHGQSVALVGPTGSGKSTIINLLLGLYYPKKGSINVNEKKINESYIRSWQKKIGFVPQEIYLSDDTVKNNIAFGIPEIDIDMDRVIKTAKMAQIHNFVLNELPNKFDTLIGEKGSRISGGQKQRIGIARALYHDPSIIIFDEATSALDNVTEKLISETIFKILKSKTIILVAHRISTIKNCDLIYIVNKGKIEAKGNYNQLLKTNDLFKNIVLGNKKN